MISELTESPISPGVSADSELSDIYGTNRATYCPEDNKLRLYVGRVPRSEYEQLRADGWTSTPKQDCDFVATWTPSRRDTCLEYAGIIEDEDQSPEDRAADRAERFSGYLDKRLSEAGGHADRYDSGPQFHGFQNKARAVRAADRHDRIAGRAVDAWEKAEYWQARTAGVIRNALHKCSPGVRMGRIKALEADLRRSTEGSAWHTHLTLRLGYENQMLAAQGGRLEQCEVLAGGKLGGRLILKVSKSSVTGRATSCDIIGPRVDGWAYQVSNIPGTEWAAYKFDLERLAPDAYTAPTPESLAELAALKKQIKAADTTPAAPPLINPTDEDAERLQAIWNENARLDLEVRNKRYGGTLADFKPSSVLRVTQASYSHNSKGTYAAAGTRAVFAGGVECDNYYSAAEKMRKKYGREVCMVRRTSGGNYLASRVIVITDKPQKKLPAQVWEAPAVAELETVNG